MSDKENIFAICSEFSDTYGFDSSDLERLVVYTKSEYINELRYLLNKQNYKIFSYQIYGENSLINFIPKKEIKDY
jgi:hypothetical protein